MDKNRTFAAYLLRTDFIFWLAEKNTPIGYASVTIKQWKSEKK